MWKKLVVAALAFVALVAAAQPASADNRRRNNNRNRRPLIEINLGGRSHHGYGYRYDRGGYGYGRGNYGYGHYYEPNWFGLALDNVRSLPFEIMESDRRAMDQIEWESQLARSQERRIYRQRSGVESYAGRNYGPYVMGRRYPWNSCSYEWNNRNTCANTPDERGSDAERELDAIDEEYTPRRSETPEPRQAPESVVIVNLLDCPARINGVEIAPKGTHTVPSQERLFVETKEACPQGKPTFDPLGNGALALVCK